jgi:hypothetical protein
VRIRAVVDTTVRPRQANCRLHQTQWFKDRICSCDGYTCCSCRRAYAWELAEPFRHGEGTHAPLPAADPDREYSMVAVNADALVRLTRAVLPAVSPTPAPDCPSGGPTTPTAIAARPPSATHHSDVSSLSQGGTVNIAGPQ